VDKDHEWRIQRFGFPEVELLQRIAAVAEFDRVATCSADQRFAQSLTQARLGGRRNDLEGDQDKG
jgi:hypothetical protein